MNGTETGMKRRAFLGGIAAAGAGGAIAGMPGSVEARDGGMMGRRDVCIFSKHLQFLDYDGAAEAASAMGFDGLDIPVRPGGHVLPERAVDDLPRAVEAARKKGLAVPMITTAINGPDSPHAEDVLRTAADLGVGYYRLGYYRYDDSLGIVGSLESQRSRLKELADMNREIGIHGDYQNHSGIYVGSPIWDIWHLMRDLDPRWIGCQYDIRHATVEGGLCWPISMKLMAKFIGTTVIKDFRWEKVDGSWKVLNTHVGEGMVDFTAYFDLIRELKISGPISMHFEYPHEPRREVAEPLFTKDLRALRGYIEAAGLS